MRKSFLSIGKWKRQILMEHWTSSSLKEAPSIRMAKGDDCDARTIGALALPPIKTCSSMRSSCSRSRVYSMICARNLMGSMVPPLLMGERKVDRVWGNPTRVTLPEHDSLLKLHVTCGGILRFQMRLPCNLEDGVLLFLSQVAI